MQTQVRLFQSALIWICTICLYPGQRCLYAYNSKFTMIKLSRREVVSYWVLVNHLEGLSLPRKSVVRLTDCPTMTIPVDLGCKANNRTTTTTTMLKLKSQKKCHNFKLHPTKHQNARFRSTDNFSDMWVFHPSKFNKLGKI